MKSSYTMSASSCVRVPLRAGTCVKVARSEAMMTLGWSVMWMP